MSFDPDDITNFQMGDPPRKAAGETPRRDAGERERLITAHSITPTGRQYRYSDYLHASLHEALDYARVVEAFHAFPESIKDKPKGSGS
jgi:hypothetical protein